MTSRGFFVVGLVIWVVSSSALPAGARDDGRVEGGVEAGPVALAPLDPERTAFATAIKGRPEAVRSRERTEQPRDPISYSEPLLLQPGTRSSDDESSIPTALASADFDEDGVPDLVCSRTNAGGSSITLYRGNVDSIFPDTPDARQRKAGSTFSGSPFLDAEQGIEMPLRSDFLAAGDFDNDGHADIVAATRGTNSLVVVAGDGQGGFGPVEGIALPGTVTALVAGEINRIDGLKDLVIGIDGPGRPALMVFEGPDGALNHEPEIVDLPAVAEFLVLTKDAELGLGNLEAVLGDEPWTLEGRNRKLSYIRELRTDIEPPTIRPTDFPILRDEDLGLAATLGTRPTVALPMRLNRDAFTDYVVIGDGPDPLIVLSAIQATITVDSSADTSTPGDGQCTLREAIVNANGDSDTTGGDCAAGSGQDLIDFAIGGGGALATITLASPLPDVTGPATLDGTTQGCTSPPCIVLDGTATTDVHGLTLTGGSTTVRGFVVQNFDQAGIYVNSDGNFVEGNYLGVDETGSTSAPNDAGVVVWEGSDNTVGGTTSAAANLASGNVNQGVRSVLSTNTTVQGNILGLDATASLAIPNFAGVEMNGTTGSTIGGTIPGARNIASGNQYGIVLFNLTDSNLVQGNHVGTDPAGSVALPNQNDGLYLQDASNNIVGGTAAGAGNLISGNLGFGILQFGNDEDGGTVIQGNYIGIDVLGDTALPNLDSGVWLSSTPDNVVGGAIAAARNVVSGNVRYGVRVDSVGSTGNAVSGNYCGTNYLGTKDVGNGLAGIYVNDTSDCIVGGTEEEAGNLVSGNDDYGIVAFTTTGCQILGNTVGTDVFGVEEIRNELTGVGVYDSSYATIGGTTPGARNLVSGNGETGMLVRADLPGESVGILVQGNYIGTDATGEYAIPNGFYGLRMRDTAESLVGGTIPAARNVISGNTYSGINLWGSRLDNSEFLGNYIGVSASGTVPMGNGSSGIFMTGSTDFNHIGWDSPGAGNVIANNGSNGISLSSAGAYTRIYGNMIGVDPSGTLAWGNAGVGISVDGTQNTRIGGTTEGTRNVISANGDNGVTVLDSASVGTSVQGNYIGTDASGTVALGNAKKGVDVTDVNLVKVGGTEPGAGNLIAGNLDAGVSITHPTIDTVGIEVSGNLIGTDVSGMLAMGNSTGVVLEDTHGITIGGTDPVARNVISGNLEDGLVLRSGADANFVRGNRIGVGITGTSGVPNGGRGLLIENSSDNSIGGTTPEEGNVIAVNGATGIEIVSGTGNGILGNSMWGNGQLGIDLAGDGVTANDTLDPDTGPNGLQNYPDLDSANATATDVTIDGILRSKRNFTYRVEFFAGESCDASGHGEGARFLGFADVTTDLGGNGSFSQTVPAPVSDGDSITATATLSGDTSEFSACVTAECSGLVTFSPTLLAQDADALVWAGAADVRYCRGDLADVGTYVTTGDGTLFGATGMDISSDSPASGSGLYYVVRPLGCGSWQTAPGAEPDRDTALP